MKAKINKIAESLYFRLTDQEVEEVILEYKLMKEYFKFCQSIDTTGVEPLIYPCEKETFYLRSDANPSSISKADVLKNVSVVEDGYVVVPAVIKNAE